MQIIGADFVRDLADAGGFSAKMVLNEFGANLFPVTSEHRAQKAIGLSYEDDYRGNALAAMLAPGRIEVRFHRDFADARVTHILDGLLVQEPVAFMRDWSRLYQGRPV